MLGSHRGPCYVLAWQGGLVTQICPGSHQSLGFLTLVTGEGELWAQRTDKRKKQQLQVNQWFLE